MSALTGNTNLSLKKMWPPVKKKAIDAHPSFGTFLSLASSGAGTGDAATAKPAAAPKAAAGRKRKAADDVKDQAAADAEDVKNQAAIDAEAIKNQAAADAAKIKGEVNSDDDDVPASKSASPVKKKAPAARKPRAKKPKKGEVHEEDVDAPGLGELLEREMWLTGSD
jgi:hypothetical protein